ncbi:MAG: BON domain-containing protein [Verrucomicrobiota bacterium]
MSSVRGVKKYFPSGIIVLLVLWLFGALIYLPSAEGKLDAAAKRILQNSERTAVFAQVKAEFKGQEATLTGSVATAAEKAQAEELIKTQIRLPGWFTSTMNPVIPPVHNEIVVDPERAPFRPRPWLILSLFGGNQRIDGVLQSAAQRQALLDAIATQLAPPAAPLNNQISIAQTSLPPANWETTTSGMPDLRTLPQDESTIAVTPCDGKWIRFPATASNPEIAAALKASKVPDNEITHALAKLRSWKNLSPEQLQQQAAAEAAAKAKAASVPNKPLGPFKGPSGRPPR